MRARGGDFCIPTGFTRLREAGRSVVCLLFDGAYHTSEHGTHRATMLRSPVWKAAYSTTVIVAAFTLFRLFFLSGDQGLPSVDSLAKDSSIKSKLKEAVRPISFALPEGRYRRAKQWRDLNKTRDFAIVLPGVKSTYIYQTEDSYYDGYAEAFFGIAMKKSGWDCLRHYEIIASGCMPYILDYHRIPENTMFDFPVNLVKQAMEVPGVPTQNQVKAAIRRSSTDKLKIDHSIFNHTQFGGIMDELVQYALEKLTWSSKAWYIFKSLHHLYPCTIDMEPRILIVTPTGCDYMSCVVYGGLYQLLGGTPETMSSWLGPKIPLFQNLAPPNDEIYGKGFSYSRIFANEWNRTAMEQLLQDRLDSGWFNIIIYTNGMNLYCEQGEYFRGTGQHSDVLWNYQKRHNPLLVTVDGSDGFGCHTFFAGDEYPLHYHVRFIREHDVGLRKDPRLPQRWSGCDSNETDERQ